MFLRPRRWGKSTFLSILATYYDIKTKDSFDEIFGRLAVGQTPTKSRNSHLVLLFDFSTISIYGSREEVQQSVFDNISESLLQFLLKYQDIFGNVLPEEYIIPNKIAASLGKVLVSKSRANITTPLNAIIESYFSIRPYRFCWRRRV